MSEYELEITGCSSEMQGVASLPDGRRAFIPYAIPGERVRAAIAGDSGRFARGRLIEVLDKSPDRVTPVCGHYGVCGGCQAQHIAYPRALKLKRLRVYDALERIGGVRAPVVMDTLPSDGVYGYRNKAEFALNGAFGGAFEGGSRRLIDIGACPLQADAANELFAFVKRRAGGLNIRYVVTRANDAGDMLITLSVEGEPRLKPLRALASDAMREFPSLKGACVCRLARGHVHALNGEIERLAGEIALEQAVCGLRFKLSPQSFFQVNTRQAEKLYGLALSLAELKGADSIADVYCGAGAISLLAAVYCARVTGIELIPEAVEDARENARVNGLEHKTRFLAGDASELYARLCFSERFDAVILDPPRKGLSESVIRALNAYPAKRLVYVSCDPATLARDVKALSSAYRLVSAHPVDMFPQTAHVETVCLLSKLHSEHHIEVNLNCMI